jgi:hypothetical protein
MPTNTQYRAANGFDILAGQSDDLGKILASVSAQVLGPKTKFCVENVSDRVMGGSGFTTGLLLKRIAVGVSDGIEFILTADDPNGTISKPWGDAVDTASVKTGGPTAVRTPGGGSGWTLAPYGVVVTASNGTGETIASVETTFTPIAADDTWVITWTRVPGATLYTVYLTTTPGTYGATVKVSGTVADPTHAKTLTAPTVGGGTPPQENTTGGAGPDYGTAPSDGSFGTADLLIAAQPTGFAVGQQWFAYFREVIPAGTSNLGNKRAMYLYPKEV